MARHRHQEFIRFLNKVNRETPAGWGLHLIVDNDATHKHPKVQAWLGRHKRFRFHFTPTSASWLNAVEGFFAKLTRQRLKRGVFNGIADLQTAINRFLKETNDSPQPFIWAADPNAIIEKVRRGKQVFESVHVEEGEAADYLLVKAEDLEDIIEDALAATAYERACNEGPCRFHWWAACLPARARLRRGANTTA